jgi:hypothetical protein
VTTTQSNPQQQVVAFLRGLQEDLAADVISPSEHCLNESEAKPVQESDETIQNQTRKARRTSAMHEGKVLKRLIKLEQRQARLKRLSGTNQPTSTQTSTPPTAKATTPDQNDQNTVDPLVQLEQSTPGPISNTNQPKLDHIQPDLFRVLLEAVPVAVQKSAEKYPRDMYRQPQSIQHDLPSCASTESLHNKSVWFPGLRERESKEWSLARGTKIRGDDKKYLCHISPYLGSTAHRPCCICTKISPHLRVSPPFFARIGLFGSKKQSKPKRSTYFENQALG